MDPKEIQLLYEKWLQGAQIEAKVCGIWTPLRHAYKKTKYPKEFIWDASYLFRLVTDLDLGI